MLGLSFPPSFLYTSWLIVELGSYDLELDTRLSEETTVLVESYTVGSFPSFFSFYTLNWRDSSQTDVPSKSAQNDSKRQNVCSSLT